MESISMLAALGLMLCAVIFKAVSAALLSQMKVRIGDVEQQRQGFLNQLKAAQAQHQVATKNQKTQDRKLTKLKGKESRLNRELKEQAPKKDRQDRRQDVLRQNLTGSSGRLD